jgi:PhnB protein
MTDDTLPIRAADGEHTVNGTPKSATAITPFLVVSPAADAIDFYVRVFGARLVDSTEMRGDDEQTIVAHAVLDFGHGHLQLGDPNPAFNLVTAPPGDADCYSIGLYCPDSDAVVARAEAAGATVREPASTFVSGDRYASIRDPFGVRWSVMTRVEDISDEESAARVAAWAASLES